MDADLCVELRERLVSLRHLSDFQFIAEWLEGAGDIRPCVADGLRKSFEARDWAMFDLYVLAAYRKRSRLYTSVLCDALDQRLEELNSENVAEVLELIADPASIPALARCVEWAPPWDDGRWLTKKCIWALGAIANEEAVAVLRRTAQDSSNEEVREAATASLTLIEQRRAAFEP